MTLNELVEKTLPLDEWINLAEVLDKFRLIDPDFSILNYGHQKLRPLLESIPEIIQLKKDNSVFPPAYNCMRVKGESKRYASLYRVRASDSPRDVFGFFSYKGSCGERWDTPFKKLAKMVKPEKWGFRERVDAGDGEDLSILVRYLNYTFLRIQQQEKIEYSIDGNKACINTGLQTPLEKDVYAVFYKNHYAVERNQPDWNFYAYADSYSGKLKGFTKLPDLATYIDSPEDLIFNLDYELEVNIEHLIQDNLERLPGIFHGNERLALTAIQGATEFLKERIKRNYQLAVPHWYNNKIQLLLPLNLVSSDKADLALVADKDPIQKIYRIRTALTMEMAYVDARLICPLDRGWIKP